MSEEKQHEILEELKEALAAVPDKYHAHVSRSLTHDIGVIARTIDMVESEAGDMVANKPTLYSGKQ